MLSAAIRAAEPTPPALDEKRLQRLVFEEARTWPAGAAASPASSVLCVSSESRGSTTRTATGSPLLYPPRPARRLREKELEWSASSWTSFVFRPPGAAAEAARQLAEGTEPERCFRNRAGRAHVANGCARRRSGRARAPARRGCPGDVVGPWRDGGDYVVNRVRERRTRISKTSRSVARGEDELLAEAIARLRAGRIRWY